MTVERMMGNGIVDGAQVAPKGPGEIALADFLAPISQEEFFRDYWEKKPLLTRGRPPGFFSPLFSIGDVDRVIRYLKPKPGRIDLVTEHGFVRDNYLDSEGCADINLVYDRYLKGSTVILSGLEQTWEPLALFTGGLEGVLNHPVAVAVYMTPPRFQGVQPHFDTQENFLLQVEGTKHWRVHGPTRELPPVEGSYMPVPRESLPELLLEATLHPGDMLYIPRGFVHEARAGDSPSLHITVDVHVQTWYDFLSDALAAWADREPRLRRSLPVGLLSDEAGSRALETGFAELLDLLRREVRLDDAVGKLTERMVVRKPPPPDGHFSLLHTEIGPQTPLRKRRVALARVFQKDGYAGVQFSGNQLVGPAKIAEPLRHIAGTETFTPAGLPGPLNENEKLVLARRLVRVGLLTLATDEGNG
jgi:ribosomal protein L16 Arg81 hydroxylase